MFQISFLSVCGIPQIPHKITRFGEVALLLASSPHSRVGDSSLHSLSICFPSICNTCSDVVPSLTFQAIDSIHQVGVYCLALVPANTLPKTPLGGIHLSETKQLFLEGSLHPCNVLMCPHTCVTNLPKPRQKQPGRAHGLEGCAESGGSWELGAVGAMPVRGVQPLSFPGLRVPRV